MSKCALRGQPDQAVRILKRNNIPQSLTGDHQVGLRRAEDVVNSPSGQYLPHRFINHFGRVVCFNCHGSQKPNYKHLLQKGICKTAFSTQEHTRFLQGWPVHPSEGRVGEPAGNLPHTASHPASQQTRTAKAPSLLLSASGLSGITSSD